MRFRWYQGFYSAGSQPVTWAIDNVYIGPQCEEMCNGHGSCINGTKCICDPGYSGPTCKISTKNPDFLKDDFEGNLTTTKWAKMCNCSQDTATRDIADLIEKKILKKSGSGRSTHYLLVR